MASPRLPKPGQHRDLASPGLARQSSGRAILSRSGGGDVSSRDPASIGPSDIHVAPAPRYVAAGVECGMCLAVSGMELQ